MRALVFGMFRDEQVADRTAQELQGQYPRTRLVNVEERRPSWRPEELPLSRLELVRAALSGAFVGVLAVAALGAALVAARAPALPLLDEIVLVAVLGGLLGAVVGPLAASARRRELFRRLRRRHAGPFVVVVDTHVREVARVLGRLRERGATPAEVA